MTEFKRGDLVFYGPDPREAGFPLRPSHLAEVKATGRDYGMDWYEIGHVGAPRMKAGNRFCVRASDLTRYVPEPTP